MQAGSVLAATGDIWTKVDLSGFSFTPRVLPFDWRLLHGVDADELVRVARRHGGAAGPRAAVAASHLHHMPGRRAGCSAHHHAPTRRRAVVTWPPSRRCCQRCSRAMPLLTQPCRPTTASRRGAPGAGIAAMLTSRQAGGRRYRGQTVRGW